MRRLAAAALAAALASAAAAAAAGEWQTRSPLPTDRGEVAGALVGKEIAIVGGFLADGASSAEVDFYSPATDSWRRAQDLPVPVNHALAAGWRGRLYVVGGYGPQGRLDGGWFLAGKSWTPLPRLPYPLAAGGAAIVGDRLYLVGGIAGAPDRSVLPRKTLVLDLRRPQRWRFAPGPRGREHLGVVAAAGRIYAVGGRSAGYDTNTGLAESWAPGERAWTLLPPVPNPRGGTGLGAVGTRLVSAGGEAPQGTIAPVYAFDTTRRRWTQLPDLPTPRHGLAVVGYGGRVYVIGGGRRPGIAVSHLNEALPLP